MGVQAAAKVCGRMGGNLKTGKGGQRMPARDRRILDGGGGRVIYN